MTIRVAVTSLTALALCACSQTPESGSNNADDTIVNDVPPLVEPTTNAETNVALPDDRTGLEEPSGPIDPKSAEAAGQVLQHYAALIEQGRWRESWELWANPSSAKEFDRNWRDDTEVHMEIGKPGGTEGAAGSSYVTVPTIFYGKTKTGDSFRRAADVTLRRVNDVPGSTEVQRRWHIERVEWKSAP